MKEDRASWVSFFQWLKGRGLEGVKLIVGDKCLGMSIPAIEYRESGNWETGVPVKRKPLFRRTGNRCPSELVSIW